MSRFTGVFVLVAAVVAGGAQAASHEKNQTVTLDRPAVVGGNVLPAGTYRIEVSHDTAKFVQGKRTVVEAGAKVGLEPAYYRGNAVHYRTVEGREQLTKIVFGTSGLALDFTTEVAAAGREAPITATADRP
jgi:hypothetical protein